VKKLPDDAYAIYLGLGPRRSHQAVADHFDVDKKTVTNRAVKESWRQRIDDHERAERERLERKAAESVEAMNDRHLKVISYIQAKGLEALKSMPLDSAIDAVRAITIAIDKERVIRGEPAQRSTIDIERRIREEHERWEAPAEPAKPEQPAKPEEPANPAASEPVQAGDGGNAGEPDAAAQ
jgi:hypothetical protein